MADLELDPHQLRAWQQDGYLVLRQLLTPAECDDTIAHMMDLHAGRKSLPRFNPRQSDDWGRTHNQHLYDPLAMRLLLHPRLRRPLAQCLNSEPDAIQTMYFWKGSQQRRHQDQYYLPGCMSAWMALQDVGPANGTIWVQPGSHRGPLLTRDGFRDADGKPQPLFGSHYDDAVDALFARHNLPEVPVQANAGDVVLFHGVLIHRGGPIEQPGSFRHVLANHYIPHDFDRWPYADWPRITFDQHRRFTRIQG